jgi:putative ABC transport system permease protein
MTLAPLALVVLLSLPFVLVVVRRPVLRRLAVRNALRRPREASLVVLGSLLGAAIITGSMVVGDTMNASIRQVARTHLGPIDEIVSARGPVDQQQLLSVYRPVAHGDIDGVLALSWIGGAVTTTGPRVLSAPRSQVVGVDFEAARQFGNDPGSTGISGPTPPAGHAAIGNDLANALGVGPGARISVRAFGIRTLLVVDRVLPRRGIAGFWLGDEQEALNVLVSPRTFDTITAGAGSGVPPTWAIAVSNRGGIERGAARTDSAIRIIRSASPAAPLDPQIYAAKQTTLDTAEAVGKGFSSMFTAMGASASWRAAPARQPVRDAGGRAQDRARDGAGGRHAPQRARRRLRHGRLALRTDRDDPRRAHGIGLGRILVAVSARVFTTEHNRFDLFFTVRPASLESRSRSRSPSRCSR